MGQTSQPVKTKAGQARQKNRVKTRSNAMWLTFGGGLVTGNAMQQAKRMIPKQNLRFVDRQGTIVTVMEARDWAGASVGAG